MLLALATWKSMIWGEYLDYRFYDLMLEKQPIKKSSSHVVIIGIDNKALDTFEEPLVFWHGYFAEAINAAQKGGAKALGIDLIQAYAAEKLVPKIDLKFSRSLRKATRAGMPVILGYRISSNSFTPHLKFKFSATDMGYLNIRGSQDSAVRKQQLYSTNQKQDKKYALAAQMIRLSYPKDYDDLPKEINIDYRLTPPKIISLATVVQLYQQNNIKELTTLFKDKQVLIGSVTAKLPDKPVVPWAQDQDAEKRIYGVLIHAYVIETLLHGDLFKSCSTLQIGLIWFFVSLISACLFIYFSPTKAIILQSLFTFFMGLLIWFAFSQYWLLPNSLIISSLTIPALYSGLYKYAIEFIQFKALKGHFQSYVNPQVMKEILANPSTISVSGKKTKCTIMFTDIRGFTTLSEHLEPEQIVKGLNHYFSEMTQAVKSQNGYLNRYLGDGILAIYGAPVELPQYGAMAAIKSGFEMLERLEKINQQQIFPQVDCLKIGIGIHTGNVIVGNIGCEEKMDYSVIGDTVNLASRIESETKSHKTDLLISYNTYQLVKNQVEVRFVIEKQVKGRAEPVKLYQIIKIIDDENERENDEQ